MRVEDFTEGARLAIDQLRANKFRSGLTVLGIVVGVATVMAMSAMIAGIRTSVFEQLDAVGPKNFMIARYDPNGVRVSDSHGPPWGNNPAITIPEVRQIAALPGVASAIAGVDDNAEISYGDQRTPSVPIAGRDAGWTRFTTGTLAAGHDMLPTDVSASRPVVVLSAALSTALFGTLDPIGRTVRLRGAPFQVIGVFDPGSNVFAGLQKNFAVIPYTAAIKHLKTWSGMLVIFTVTSPTFTQDEAMDQVIATLRTTRGLRPADPNDFAVVRQEQLVESFNKITGVFFVVMLALSSVALMVGGVGVIAIMMIAVTERTREIGIRKALGATRREILWQFLFEAVTVTTIGGIIGMAVGGSVAFLIARLTPIPATVPLPALLAALVMAAVAGILFGLWPAWRAARMDPVVALRFE